MGVPAFFRWVINSSPQTIQQAVYPRSDQKTRRTNPEESSSNSNPQVDNLYFDMNGIIHPCSHPQGNCGVPIPQNEEDMHSNIRRYLDLLISIVAPKKLIYFAIDGVAPKAKMNQQRSRRFRAAQEIQSGEIRRVKVAENLRKKGIHVPSDLINKKHWDHNVITPGTEFMERVSNMLKSYIADNLVHNPLWSGLEIIFSDATIPKEGEHKILEHIRLQRTQDAYDPNTR